MRFNIGDIVRISSQSVWCGHGHCNPKNINGVIIRISQLDAFGGLPIVVSWGENKRNRYNENDLKLYKRNTS